MYRFFVVGLAIMLTAVVSVAEPVESGEPIATASPEVLRSYRRLLPLEGGSNFRDLGGYPTADGKTVKRGLLFRSGAMSGLTVSDQAYLDQFGFKTVVDLRSTEGLELYPSQWAEKAEIAVMQHDYSLSKQMQQRAEERADEGAAEQSGDSGFYQYVLQMLKPQLTAYFETLVAGRVPAVVNCSAGQDRTGVTSALLLTVLGVEQSLIIEDYLLSTDFRSPSNESGGVDLEKAAEGNAFAAMMLHYKAESPNPDRPNSLITPDGVPFIMTTLSLIDTKWGSVANYLEAELGISPLEQAQLRSMYTY